MRFYGFFYILLAFLFVYLTYIQVEANGWGIFPVVLAFVAAVDFYLGWQALRRPPKDK
ncbi:MULTISPECIES: DUF4305 domain-containing protein [Shouchella]|uniref:DUF4305 domain-containing protein n=2 Tax=Shouchella TaxID=2893057 RepID=A0ABY7WAA3_9BACI|nr:MULTISPECIES: DUF4305 domain-containing protein [Shouchella]MED4128998.1 DUF4305 domain-containing protein [Shouchella miscanthi]WDF04544.1 DUF4305 domain-containing protein [Shouchella hunanensis]GAF22380.1 hypothetical protein JCM19047_2127 [Bacillus sp. JCM 19047]